MKPNPWNNNETAAFAENGRRLREFVEGSPSLPTDPLSAYTVQSLLLIAEERAKELWWSGANKKAADLRDAADALKTSALFILEVPQEPEVTP